MRDYLDYIEDCREYGQEEPLSEKEFYELLEEMQNGFVR